MANFFKTFFLGILYIILLPFIVVLLALYFVYCIIVFILMSLKSIVIFFGGGKPLGDLKEDIEAKKIIEARRLSLQQPSPQSQSNYYCDQNNNGSENR